MPRLRGKFKPLGNEKYKELVRKEREWLKGSKRCKICGYHHPPMRYDGLRYDGPQREL